MLAPLAVSAVWVQRTVYDTDGYVAAVAPLADEPAMQDAVIARTVDAIDHALDRVPTPDVGALGQFAVGEARAALQRQVASVTKRFVGGEQFAELWARLNRLGHEEAVAWFSGESSRVSARVVDDQLVISLQPLVEEVANRVDGLGLAGLSGDRIRRRDPKIVLVDGRLVGPVQVALRTLNDLAPVLPVFAALALIGALVAATDRRRALARLGIALVIGMGVALVALRISHEEFVNWISTTSVSVPASEAFFDTLSRGLRDALLIGVFLGSGMALAARFAGGRGAAAGAPSSVGSFLAVHVAGASVVLVLVGLGVLAFIPSPTLLVAAVVGAVVVVGVVGLQVFATRTRVAPASP